MKEINELDEQIKILKNKRYELDNTIDKLTENLISLQTKLKNLAVNLDSRASLEFPFAHPFYWAGFVCQGLEKKLAPLYSNPI